MLSVGSLFSGIGGFDLGLERAGMRTAWFCEQDEFCQRVLAKHWPDVPCYADVRELAGATVQPVDVLCGGFPCQDLSNAWQGVKSGLNGNRSGLWSEFARLIGELQPRYILVENVAAIRRRGQLGRVLGDLAALGYDAEWDCIPASAAGAPHQRDRAWIVAYPQGGGGSSGSRVFVEVGTLVGTGARSGNRDESGDSAPRIRLVGSGLARSDGHSTTLGCRASTGFDWWASEPPVDRLAHGVPGGLARRRALGNALVPQIAEWIGRRIIAYEEGRLAA